MKNSNMSTPVTISPQNRVISENQFNQFIQNKEAFKSPNFIFNSNDGDSLNGQTLAQNIMNIQFDQLNDENNIKRDQAFEQYNLLSKNDFINEQIENNKILQRRFTAQPQQSETQFKHENQIAYIQNLEKDLQFQQSDYRSNNFPNYRDIQYNNLLNISKKNYVSVPKLQDNQASLQSIKFLQQIVLQKQGNIINFDLSNSPINSQQFIRIGDENEQPKTAVSSSTGNINQNKKIKSIKFGKKVKSNQEFEEDYQILSQHNQQALELEKEMGQIDPFNEKMHEKHQNGQFFVLKPKILVTSKNLSSHQKNKDIKSSIQNLQQIQALQQKFKTYKQLNSFQNKLGIGKFAHLDQNEKQSWSFPQRRQLKSATGYRKPANENNNQNKLKIICSKLQTDQGQNTISNNQSQIIFKNSPKRNKQIIESQETIKRTQESQNKLNQKSNKKMLNNIFQINRTNIPKPQLKYSLDMQKNVHFQVNSRTEKRDYFKSERIHNMLLQQKNEIYQQLQNQIDNKVNERLLLNKRKSNNKINLDFQQNNLILQQMFDRKNTLKRPISSYNYSQRKSQTGNFKDIVQKNICTLVHEIQEKKKKKDLKIQSENLHHLIRECKNIASQESIQKLALFDNQLFLKDPLSFTNFEKAYEKDYEMAETTKYSNFEKIQRNFAVNYILNNMNDKSNSKEEYQQEEDQNAYIEQPFTINNSLQDYYNRFQIGNQDQLLTNHNHFQEQYK